MISEQPWLSQRMISSPFVGRFNGSGTKFVAGVSIWTAAHWKQKMALVPNDSAADLPGLGIYFKVGDDQDDQFILRDPGEYEYILDKGAVTPPACAHVDKGCDH